MVCILLDSRRTSKKSTRVTAKQHRLQKANGRGAGGIERQQHVR